MNKTSCLYIEKTRLQTGMRQKPKNFSEFIILNFIVIYFICCIVFKILFKTFR